MLVYSAPLLIGIALCVHVVRTNQPLYWIFLILFIPVLGSLVYFIAIVLPDLTGGTRAKRMGMAARDALDPGREYRQAKAATDESPTVHNRMRLAAAGRLARPARRGRAALRRSDAGHPRRRSGPAAWPGQRPDRAWPRR
ncbi:MAG: hypothetical protein WDM85_14280 [Caulobacteraceae bacterium]